MPLDGRITHVTTIEAEVYRETPECSGPRGLGESSVTKVTFESGPEAHLVTMSLGGERYFVPVAVLDAAKSVSREAMLES